MDTLTSIGIWLFLAVLFGGFAVVIFCGIRAKVRYYKSLAAEARFYLTKDKQ